MGQIKKLIASIVFFIIVIPIFGQYKKITLEDLFQNYTLYPNEVYGLQSMNDGQNYSVREGDDIVKYSYKNGDKVGILFKASEVKLNRWNSYEFSNDESKILLQTENEQIYRRSYTSRYILYDSKSQKISDLSKNGKQQLATFSPDGNKVAFVRKNNLFIRDLITDSEFQVTSDGKYNEIINGAPDWVYEEEFEFNKAFEWSPDGNYLAYIRFDESKVKMFNLTIFAGLEPRLDENGLYPENRTFKYPKAGDANSLVSVKVYNLKNKTTSTIDIGSEPDIYIPRIRWTNDPKLLSVFRLNRLQNKFEILLTNPENGSSRVLYTEENKYWFDEGYFDAITFLDGNKNFIIVSEKDGYRHLYLYDMNGILIRQLTKGSWDLDKYLGYDKKNQLFYYTSGEESPVRRSAYSIDFEGKNKKKITSSVGTNSLEFSKSYDYFVNTFSNINTPDQVTVCDSKGNLIRPLEKNEEFAKSITEYGDFQKQLLTFKTSEGVELNAYMIKPPDFDISKKYPVLITQYIGPNSQSVRDNWSFGWNEMLAQKGIIIFTIDTRGTGFKGEEFRKMTYLQLGKYETIDIVETSRYLQSLPYVDAARIGIWGWSYGGFMVCSALTKGADYFKMGVAVAPVTNWRYYDNIYTERFMRTPQVNPTGYDNNSPINFANRLKGKLLLIHGSGDDNVHLQNTMEFSEALVQAGKQFQQMIYTNRNHGIYGGNTTMHLYSKMTNFILEEL